VAADDQLFANASSSVSIPVSDLLANDSDADGDTLVVTSVTSVSGGSGVYGNASLDQNTGEIGYTTNTAAARALREGETATDTLSYVVSDGNGGTASANIEVTIVGVNDAPIAQNDTLNLVAGRGIGSLEHPLGLLYNDSDVDNGDSLRVTSVDSTQTQGRVLFDPRSVGLLYIASGDVFRAMAADEVGTDSFNYTVTDDAGASSTARVDINVTGINDAPEAQGDALTLNAGTALTDLAPTVLENDIEYDNGDTKTITGVETANTAGAVTFDVATQSLAYAANGHAFAALSAGETATDQFRYSIADANGAQSSADVLVTVTGVNDAPEAQRDLLALNAGASLTGLSAILLANDTDVDNGDTKTIVSVDATNTQANVTFNLATQALSYSATGSFFDALAAGERLRDKFAYTVADSLGAQSSATVDVDVVGVNDAPELQGLIESQQTDEDGLFTLTISRNVFRDVDRGDLLSFSASSATGAALPEWLAFNAETLTFRGRPANKDVGELALQVTATDAGGLSASATFGVTVVNTNDAPIGFNDTVSVTGGTKSSNLYDLVLANDVDVDVGDTKNILSLNITGTVGGVVLDDSTRSLIYDATGDAVKSLAAGETAVDSFDYVVADKAGVTSAARVFMNLTGVNDAPVARDDAFTLTQNQYTADVGAYLLSNDIEHDRGDTKTLTSVEIGTTKGLVTFDTITKALSYDARTTALRALGAGQSATDTLRYTVADSAGLESSASVVVTVTGENDAPILVRGIANQSMQAGQTYTISLASDAFKDVDTNDTLTLSAKLADGSALPSWITFNAATRTFSASPAAMNVGSASVVVTATDSGGLSASSSFAIDVRAPSGVTLNGTTGTDVLIGGLGNDTIFAGNGNDVVAGGAGNDQLYGESGNDLLLGGAGSDYVSGGDGTDILDGGEGNDLLNGGNGTDLLAGGQGNDVLEGGAGADVLTDLQGNNLLNGQEGDDLILSGGGNNVLIGGSGRDTILSGSGNDAILFNRGDGVDNVQLGGGRDSLSLGRGIDYNDLAFERSGNNLRLNVGQGESLLFNNWYGAGASRSLVNLQIINAATSNFAPTSGNPLRDNAVENFNFQQLVANFDAARQANFRLSRWNLMNGMGSAHSGGSDSAALGGDFAYRYGIGGSLAGIGIDPAQALTANASMNAQATALSSVASLQTGAQRLS
ncbi:MAG: tandem-95 repeat protein, partial [Rhodocyclaceae bacterium]|nr:tandem-95 repeat protein [Rhodocyclaceae bacterium]